MKVASPAALAGLLQSRLEENGDPRRIVTLSDLLASILPYPVVRAALDLAGKGEYDLALLGFLRRGDLVQVDPAVVAAVEQAAESPEPSLDFASSLQDSLLRLRRIVEVPAADRRVEPGPVARDASPEPDAYALTPEVADSEPEASPPASEPEAPAAEPETAPLIDPTEFWAPAPEPPTVTPDVPTAAASDFPTFVLPPRPEPDPSIEPAAHADPPLADPRVVTEPDPWVPEPTPVSGCWQCSEPLPDRPIVFFCTQCGVSQDNRRCPECGDRVEAAWHFCSRCGTGLRTP